MDVIFFLFLREKLKKWKIITIVMFIHIILESIFLYIVFINLSYSWITIWSPNGDESSIWSQKIKQIQFLGLWFILLIIIYNSEPKNYIYDQHLEGKIIFLIWGLIPSYIILYFSE